MATQDNGGQDGPTPAARRAAERRRGLLEAPRQGLDVQDPGQLCGEALDLPGRQAGEQVAHEVPVAPPRPSNG